MSIKSVVFISFLVVVTSAAAAPREFSFAAGAFKFNATDYYYPNFYDEAGYRGEFGFAKGETWRHHLRLQFYGYPGDDNIFETILEYGLQRKLTLAGFDVDARPVAGLGVVKLQYPAPYYPTVEHQFLPWLRVGDEVALGHKVAGPVWLYAGDRGRLLYHFGDYGAFNENPAVWQNGPFGLVEVRIGERWRLTARGGAELGGYYDDVFLTPDEKVRPFGEVGCAYGF
jgi:hypothetical protein